MTLELLPMVEADIDAFFDIMWAAFNPGFYSMMYPNGFTKAAREQNKQSYLREWRRHPERTKMMKVVDHSLPENHPQNKIIGVSKWRFFAKDRSDAEMAQEKSESKAEPSVPDVDGPMSDAFAAAISQCKEEIIGRKAYALCYIVGVSPDHHRRGVGKLHLNWGLEEADRLGVPVYLEASGMGKPLYERLGFDTIKVMPFDARDFGHDDALEHTIMVRPVPKAAKKAVTTETKTAQKVVKSVNVRTPLPHTGHEIHHVLHAIPSGITSS